MQLWVLVENQQFPQYQNENTSMVSPMTIGGLLIQKSKKNFMKSFIMQNRNSDIKLLKNSKDQNESISVVSPMSISGLFKSRVK